MPQPEDKRVNPRPTASSRHTIKSTSNNGTDNRIKKSTASIEMQKPTSVSTNSSTRVPPRPLTGRSTSTASATSTSMPMSATTVTHDRSTPTRTTSAASSTITRPSSRTKDVATAASRESRIPGARSTTISSTKSTISTTSSIPPARAFSNARLASKLTTSSLPTARSVISTNLPSRTKPQTTTAPSTRTTSKLPTGTAHKSTTTSPVNNSVDTTTRRPGVSTHSPSTTSTTRLRDELIQLSHLHQTSAKTLKTYTNSISSHLTAKSSKLQALETQVLNLESQHLQSISTDALIEWLNLNTSTSNPQSITRAETQAARKIQLLSSTIRDLNHLLTQQNQPSSSSTPNPLFEFETWLATAQNIRNERTSSHHQHSPPPPTGKTSSPPPTPPPTKPQNELINLIQPLPTKWRTQTTDLKHTISTLIRSLDSLDETGQYATKQTLHHQHGKEKEHKLEAGIHTLLSRYRKLAAGLQAEIEMAITIEKGIMAEEGMWRKEMVVKIMQEYGAANVDVRGEEEEDRPVWTM